MAALKREGPLKPGVSFGRRVKQARRRQGLSQQQLSERLGEVGHPTSAQIIARVEAGTTRGVRATVADLMAYSVALQVAPVHLLLPTDDETEVAVTPTVTVSAAKARSWVRGEEQLDEADDPRVWLTEADETSMGLILAASGSKRAMIEPAAPDETSAEFGKRLLKEMAEMAEATGADEERQASEFRWAMERIERLMQLAREEAP